MKVLGIDVLDAVGKLDLNAQNPAIGAAERVDAIHAEMAEADRVHAENLAAVRRAADLTQVELAKAMGVAQSEISRIESRPDMLLSTLASYLAATGDRPRVVVTIAGHDIEVDLTPLIRH
jgi:DNA-binding XRE family transcriptional regulator